MDVITSKILVKLPIKLLIRLKSMSKSCSDIVSSREFGESYFRTEHGFILQQTKRTELFTNRTECYYFASCDKPDELVSLPFPISKSVGFSLIGSSNGLVCLTVLGPKFTFLIYLWNPTNGEYKLLPSDETHRTDVTGIGFGFVNDDYKVVRAKRVKVKGFKHRKNQFQVYSLKRNSWRIAGLAPAKVFTGVRGLFAQGAVHWETRSYYRNYDIVLSVISFDMSKEVCKVLKLPDYVKGARRMLSLYKKNLCIVHEVSSEKLDVFVRSKTEIDFKWTKRASVELPTKNKISRLLAFCEKGEVVLNDYNRNLYLWDPESLPNLWDAVSYTRSLVSFDAYKVTKDQLSKKRKRCSVGKRTRKVRT